MGAEEERRAAAVRCGEPAEDASGIALEHGRGVVLVPLELERGQVRADAVGDRALAPGGARDRAELEEVVEESRRRHDAIVVSAPLSGARRRSVGNAGSYMVAVH